MTSEEVDYKSIIDQYKAHGVIVDEEMVTKAIKFAVEYHGHQKRASGEPYYLHPLAVAEIVAKFKFDSASIVTAILHDTIEDTHLTYQDIEYHFSSEIAQLVDGVTKLTKIKFEPYDLRQTENFRKLLVAMSYDIRVLIVKLADRLHNMRTIDFISKKEKRERIALETLEIYAPLAERIGMQKLKVELQDIAFRILYPDIRKSIVARLEGVAGNTEDVITKIIDALKNTVTPIVPNARIYGRKKTPYSVWMKMKQKNVTIDQLSDVIAFRIITQEITECYKILGLIHSHYKMVPSCFQDFISTPKNNGYQSIHTVVMGPFGCKIEVQIRTEEMHQVAELGLAAHWRYKQGHNDHIDGTRYNWIRELLSIINNNSAPGDERLHHTKLAMYYDQVFCFTPKGKVISLPKGATSVDFAYMVHSDIGNHCSAAKVNGVMVPLSTELLNGDQVEIITSPSLTVSANWESFVVTGKARAEIRKMAKSQQREQYIKLGHSILSKALAIREIAEEEAINAACSFFNKSREELFCAIGQGVISREEVIKQLQVKKSKFLTLSMLLPKNRNKLEKLKQENKVSIQGLISGVAIHFAKCCNPILGDNIKGVMHTGTGVTIHVTDCPMLKNFTIMPERIIELTWDSNIDNIPFVGCIDVTMINEPSSLSIVTSDIAKVMGNITNFKILNREENFFVIRFYIQVSSAKHFEQIINNLKMKKVVQKIHKIKKPNTDT